MEEEEFEFLDNHGRISPTDFELIETERVRNLDNQEIIVHEDYFLNDSSGKTSATEDSSEDDFVPVRRSKRNKKSKSKNKKSLQTLSDVKSKIPKVKNRTSSGSIPTKIIKNKPLYSQILQGAVAKVNEDEGAKKTEDAACNTEESNNEVHVVDCGVQAVSCEPERCVELEAKKETEPEAEPETEPEVEPEAEPDDSEVEVMKYSVSEIKESADELIARESKATSIGESSIHVTVPVDEPIIFAVEKINEVCASNVDSMTGSQLLETLEGPRQEEEKDLPDDDEIKKDKEEEEEEEGEEENNEECEKPYEETELVSSITCESHLTRSYDEYGLKALFEERLVCDDSNNSLIAIKTSTLMLAVLLSVVFGMCFGNCLVSIFMPAHHGRISVDSEKEMDNVEKPDDPFIMVKVDPAPPLFNYSSIWFGRPTEENLRSIFNEFRRLQRDHIRLQEAYSELRENIHLEKQMKWYWRKQARKDVVSLNSVKYTLHDGLMKVVDVKPIERSSDEKPNVSAAETVDKEESCDYAISNLTESLEDEQKASSYWQEMYNKIRLSHKVNTSKDYSIPLLTRSQLKKIKLAYRAYNFSTTSESTPGNAWHRMKSQWKQKMTETAAKENARVNVNRFRKIFSMSNLVNSPREQSKVKNPPMKSHNAGTENVVCEEMEPTEKHPHVPGGISCKTVPETVTDFENINESKRRDEREEKGRDENTPPGMYISILVRSYNKEYNYSMPDNYLHNCHNFPAIYNEEHKQLRWFKSKYEELLLLSEISKWRNKYEIKKTIEKAKRDIAQLHTEKEKEIGDLHVQRKFVQWELASAKQMLFSEKKKVASEKEKFEKLLGSLDRILKTNEETMETWKKYEKGKMLNKVKKLVKKIKKQERSKAKDKVDEARAVLRSYIKEELKRIDERRRVENRNEELKKKLKAKVKHYKGMYEQAVEERTKLRNFFNEARTEASIQKSFINSLLSKIKDLKHYKSKYEQSVEEGTSLNVSFKEARTEASIQRSIINNLLTKIKDYRKKARDYEKEKRQSTENLQSYLDILTATHDHGNQETGVTETTPHNEHGDMHHLSIRFPEEEIYKPQCEKEETEMKYVVPVDITFDEGGYLYESEGTDEDSIKTFDHTNKRGETHLERLVIGNSTFFQSDVFDTANPRKGLYIKEDPNTGGITIIYRPYSDADTDIYPPMPDIVSKASPPKSTEMPQKPIPSLMPPLSIFPPGTGNENEKENVDDDKDHDHHADHDDEHDDDDEDDDIYDKDDDNYEDKTYPPISIRSSSTPGGKPHIFIGPVSPPAPYLEIPFVRKRELPHSIKVDANHNKQGLDEVHRDDLEMEDEMEGPSPPRRNIKSNDMSESSSSEVDKIGPDNAKKTNPKTEVMYISEGGVDMIFNTTRVGDGIVVSGRVVRKNTDE